MYTYLVCYFLGCLLEERHQLGGRSPDLIREIAVVRGQVIQVDLNAVVVSKITNKELIKDYVRL